MNDLLLTYENNLLYVRHKITKNIITVRNVNYFTIQFPFNHNSNLDMVNSCIFNNTILYNTYGAIYLYFFYYNDNWFCIDVNDIIEIIDPNGCHSDFIIQLDVLYTYYISYNSNPLINCNKQNKYIIYNIWSNILGATDYICQTNKIYFDSFDQLKLYLINLNKKSYLTKKIFQEGIMIYYNNTYINIQIECYCFILNSKPNYNNLNIDFLCLYQKDKLFPILPYYTNYCSDVLNRIHNSVKTLANDILNLYNSIDEFNDNDIPLVFRQILLEINNINNNDNDIKINIHHIYYYLKKIDFDFLLNLFKNRYLLINSKYKKYIDCNCIYIKTQTILMLGT